MKFVADAADIVRGATNFMWSNSLRGNFCSSCVSKLLHMTSNFAPHVEQFATQSTENYAVLTQSPFCHDLRTFEWSKTLVCGAKMTNIMYHILYWRLCILLYHTDRYHYEAIMCRLFTEEEGSFPRWCAPFPQCALITYLFAKSNNPVCKLFIRIIRMRI